MWAEGDVGFPDFRLPSASKSQTRELIGLQEESGCAPKTERAGSLRPMRDRTIQPQREEGKMETFSKILRYRSCLKADLEAELD